MNDAPGRIVIGITGSSGPHYGVRVLELLKRYVPSVERHLIMSAGARRTIEYEMHIDPEAVVALADVVHAEADTSASIASGSFVTLGMIVAPCSIKTLSAIANSYDDNLIVRAADVSLKERRRVVLLVRETPLHQGHLRLMSLATEAGAVVFPPVPSFYHLPTSIQDIIDHTVVRALDQFGIHLDAFPRWAGLPQAGPIAPDDKPLAVALRG